MKVLAAVAFLVVFIVPPAVAVAATPAPVSVGVAKRFAVSVLYETNSYYGRLDHKTKRWAGLPNLEIDSDDATLGDFARSAFDDIAHAAGLTLPTTQKITVHIGNSERLMPLRQKLVPAATPSATWSWSRTLDKEDNVLSGRIFIPTDLVPESVAKRTVLRCLLFVFGFPGPSTEVRDSIFDPGVNVSTLGMADRQLISF